MRKTKQLKEMKKKFFKATLAVAAVATVGLGTYKAYEAYKTENMTENDLLLSENVLAFSEGDEIVVELCASMTARSSVTIGGTVGSICPSGTSLSYNPVPYGALPKCGIAENVVYYDIQSKFGYCYRDVIR